MDDLSDFKVMQYMLLNSRTSEINFLFIIYKFTTTVL